MKKRNCSNRKIKTVGKIETTCDNCNQIFFIYPCEFNRSKHHFCEKSCKVNFLRGIHAPTFGYHHTEEAKKRISETHMGELHYNYKKHLSKELKEKLSIIKIGKKKSKETRKRMSEAQKGRIVTQEVRDRISKTLTGRHQTEEEKQHHSEGITKHMELNPCKYQSSFEKAYEKILDSLNIEYKRQFRIKGLTHPFDFAIPKWKLLIEIDGEYWHSRSDTMKRDKRISNFVEQSEWGLLRITENNLREWNVIK